MYHFRKIFLYLSSILFVTGCATFESEKKYVDYSQTHVVKIEESIQGLDVYNFISDDVDPNEVIALAPTELDAKYESDPRDLGVRYIIEDNLISQLVQYYPVAERDQSLMYYLERETGEKYNKYTRKLEGKESNVNEKAKSPEATTITNNYYGDVSGISSISEAKTEDKESEFTVSTDFVAADKLLTYRVLECGVYFKEPEIQMQNVNVATMDWVDRYARTRLHCRLEDAKTGVILNAGILEHEVVDKVRKSDLSSLENINYAFYQHKLPTIKSEEQKIGEIISDKKQSSPIISTGGGGLSPRLILGAGALLLLMMAG